MSLNHDNLNLLRLRDVHLPSHPLGNNVALAQEANSSFNLKTLAAAISDGCHFNDIKSYLQSYPFYEVHKNLQSPSQSVNGQLYHPGFYAAKKNCSKTMGLLLEYGMDANSSNINKIPLLAFAIMWTKCSVVDATELAKLLLSQGASPNAIPKDMWDNYLEIHSITSANVGSGLLSVWCNPRYRKVLAETLNFSIRYFLHRASQLRPPTGREMQLAKAHKITRFLKVPYQMIGQEHACELVVDTVFAHISMSKSKPLILSFVGLSGHGKTELANQMGDLLSVETLVLDMTQIRHETDLFGCLPPYMGYDKGSVLNNFLAKHSGERTVVFLDEFDKTCQDVRESLLIVLDSGRYRDHCNDNMVDASNTIWIFATNLGTVPVREFYTSNLDGKKTTERIKVSLVSLLFELSQLFMTHYTPAVAGRINAIVPFFPFHLGEQAVVAHKFLLQLMREVRLPVDVADEVNRYIGHVRLALLKDSQLCVHLARQYIQDLGARSLSNAVDGVGRKLFARYADTDEEVTESVNDGPLQKFAIQLHPIKDDVHEIVVFPDGDTHYHRGVSRLSSNNSEADPNDFDEGSDEGALYGAEEETEF